MAILQVNLSIGCPLIFLTTGLGAKLYGPDTFIPFLVLTSRIHVPVLHPPWLLQEDGRHSVLCQTADASNK